MIVPYASDDENDRSRDENDITIINDKDINIETGENSEDHVKPDNLFAFDVNNFSKKRPRILSSSKTIRIINLMINFSKNLKI